MTRLRWTATVIQDGEISKHEGHYDAPAKTTPTTVDQFRHAVADEIDLSPGAVMFLAVDQPGGGQ